MLSFKFKKKILGFTFLEIMVAVAIIAILASLSIIATTRVRLKSRDIKRISNATEIVSALEAYYAANQSYPTMIFPGQPIESNGREFLRAVPSNPSPRTDGGCADSDYTYITTTKGYKLTFCIGSDNSRFAQGIVICKNGNCGVKDGCSGEVLDSEGTRYPIVGIGDQCWMATHLKTKRKPDSNSCINNIYPSLEYSVDLDTCLVQWLSTRYPGWPLLDKDFGGYGCFPSGCVPGSRRDCIKSIGPIIPNGTWDPDPNWEAINNTGWQNRGNDVSIYDYPPTHEPSPGVYSDCNYRGALYSWAGAMNLPDWPPDSITDCATRSCAGQITVPHRGICPVDWHIPTDEEFHTLESTLASGGICDSNRNSHTAGSDSCAPAGIQLRQGGGSGFEANLLGVREEFTGTDFRGIDTTVNFWTASESGPSTAIVRAIDAGIDGTYRFSDDKTFGFAVRCIRDY